MMIDAGALLGRELPRVTSSWDERDVILYHLGVGAGNNAAFGDELHLTYERQLGTLPTFASVACAPGLRGFKSVDGLPLQDVVVIHMEHEVRLGAAPIPTAAAVVHTGNLSDLRPHRLGTLAGFTVDTVLEGSGDLVFQNRATFLLRGLTIGTESESESAVARGRAEIPDRPPEIEVPERLLRQQALLYRLSGDKNPLHVDAQVSTRAGYEAPLLHGLCTYGIACRHASNAGLSGELERIRSFGARFTGPLFPGQEITTRLWVEPDAVIAAVYRTGHDRPVLIAAAGCSEG